VGEQPARTSAEKQALRALVLAERRRVQRRRWRFAGVSAGAVTSASLLGLVVTGWMRQAHQPAPQAHVLTERRVIATIRYVRPKPRIKVIKVVRQRPAAAAGSVQRVAAPITPAPAAPSRTAAPAPAVRVQVQVSKPVAAPPPPPVATHAS
jgi:hypothetical protein